MKEIKDEWVFLNDNSSRNFLKYINTSTKETYSDYKRLRHLPRSAYADLHISEFTLNTPIILPLKNLFFIRILMILKTIWVNYLLVFVMHMILLF